jgi:hypothetical protein
MSSYSDNELAFLLRAIAEFIEQTSEEVATRHITSQPGLLVLSY